MNLIFTGRQTKNEPTSCPFMPTMQICQLNQINPDGLLAQQSGLLPVRSEGSMHTPISAPVSPDSPRAIFSHNGLSWFKDNKDHRFTVEEIVPVLNLQRIQCDFYRTFFYPGEGEPVTVLMILAEFNDEKKWLASWCKRLGHVKVFLSYFQSSSLSPFLGNLTALGSCLCSVLMSLWL